MTQQQQRLAEARIAYIVGLNETKTSRAIARFSVYLLKERLNPLSDEGALSASLEVLWPTMADMVVSDLLPYQVRWDRDKKYPQYHFALGNETINKLVELGSVLRTHNRELRVMHLGGYSPRVV